MSDFQVGDVVQLKSGGPEMTVTVIMKESGFISCAWQVDIHSEKVSRDTFPPAALKKIK